MGAGLSFKCILKMKKIFLVIIFLLPFYCFSQSDFSDEIVFTSLESARRQPENVKVLKLKRKKLKEFPVEILSFTNLRSLDLSSNKIRRIPDGIDRLTQLEVLNLGNNRIEVLPASIGNLKNLTELNLNRNDLITLPSSVGRLMHLKKLILWSTNIDTFPEEIAALDGSLELLDMRSIRMNTEKQQIIRSLLPNTAKRFDHPCNCY